MLFLDVGADFEMWVIMHLHGTQGSMFWVLKFEVNLEECTCT